MKAAISIVLVALLTSNSYAQKIPKFGKVSKEDILMETYEEDTSAHAVVLGDYGVASIIYLKGEGFIINFEKLTRIKILDKEGYDWADVTLSIYDNQTAKESFGNFKAVTYNNENGEIVESKLSRKDYFVEKYDKNHDLIKFTMPNVSEGSVIEYTYTIKSPFLFNFPDWYFQYDIPVRHSEYHANIPEYFIYKTIGQGYLPLQYDVEKSPNQIRITSSSGVSTIDYTETNHHWMIDNTPAFKEEPFMASKRNFISKMKLELATIMMPGEPIDNVMGTWSGLNKTFLEDEDFGLQVKGSGFLKRELSDLNLDDRPPEEKIALIMAHVKSTVDWNGNYRRYAGRLKNAYDEGSGSSAEVNLILVSMLQKAGISADPVLISTRDNGFVNTNFPLSSQFNYVIAAVDIGNQTILMDATDPLLPFHMLPERCLNGQGWRVSETKPGFVNLVPADKSKTVVFGQFTLDQDLFEFKGSLSSKYYGYEAHRQRSEIIELGEDEYQENYLLDKYEEVSEFSFDGTEDIMKPCKEGFNVSIPADLSGDFIYLDPLANEKIQENYFKLDERTYPIDFSFPYEKSVMMQYNIPEGYFVEEFPEQKIIALPDRTGEFSYNVAVNGNIMVVSSILKINKSVFLPQEYPALKEFFAQVVEKQNEMIVLKHE